MSSHKNPEWQIRILLIAVIAYWISTFFHWVVLNPEMREKRAKTYKTLENDIKAGWMILQDTHFTLWRNTGHSPLERKLRQTHLAGYIHKDTWFQLSSNILVLVKLDHFHFPLIEHCLLIGVKMICLKKVMTQFNLPY